MDHNRFLFSSFFVLFLASTLNIHCAQPHTKQQNTTDLSYKIVSILPHTEDSTIEYNPSNMVLKIHNDKFLLIDGNDTSSAHTFSIQKNELDDMISAATKAQRSQCYVHIKQKNTDFYFKIPKATLEDANRQEPALGITPTKTDPQSKSKKPQKILPSEPDLPPIDPENFKLPYPNINKNSDITALSDKDMVQPLEEIEKQFKVELEEAKNKTLAEILAAQKDANDNSQNELKRYYQDEYQKKINTSVEYLPDATLFSQHLFDKEEFDSINKKLKETCPFEISQEEYSRLRFEGHIKKYASWDIEQFNKYNQQLKTNGLPTVSYDEFCKKVASFKITQENTASTAEKERGQTTKRTPAQTRYELIREQAKQQFAEIQKIEEQTKQIEKMTEMNSPQNYAKAIMISRGAKFAIDSALEEALLFSALSLVSLIPDAEREKTIASLEKENKKLDKIFDQRKTHFNLLADEGSIERRKIEVKHEKQIRANKQIADKLKKRPRKEQIEDIQEDLNKQRAKYVPTK